MQNAKKDQIEDLADESVAGACSSKHYGSLLYTEGDEHVMRCSFCQQIFKIPVGPVEPKKKSSRTCVSACDWVTEGRTVRCLACSYIGPLPTI